MDFDEEDQTKRRFPKIPKYFPDLEIFKKEKNDVTDEENLSSSIKFIPIPVQINSAKRPKDQDSDSEDDYEERRDYNAKLDNWDKGARAWLSSGTIFFLIIMFHLIQVRNDLRNFTYTANNELKNACSVLEDKTISFQAALDLAAQDVGPITFKFVRDLKTKVKSAFHFAGQIFGGKVREVFVSLFQQYYCFLVGALVIFKSLTDNLTKMLIEKFSDGNDFIKSLLEVIDLVIKHIVEIVSNPEKYFAEKFGMILDIIFDKTMTAVVIPSLADNSVILKICGKTAERELKFSDIDALIKGYMAKIIAIITVILVLYNYFRFVITLETEEAEKSEDEETDQSEIKEKKRISDDTKIPLSSLWNSFGWFKNFLIYQPFWMFLFMGILGYVHINFSASLRSKAEELKANFVDPKIEELKTDFTKALTTYLLDLEERWKQAFRELMKPFTSFIDSVANLFGTSFNSLLEGGRKITDYIYSIIQMIDGTAIGRVGLGAIIAILDCFILSNIEKWSKIVGLINAKLFGGKWNDLNGGIIVLLQKSITDMFRKLQLTKHLKSFFSMHFSMFLNLLMKRSVFLYVYLILCAILLFQGVFMMLIKFILGYF